MALEAAPHPPIPAVSSFHIFTVGTSCCALAHVKNKAKNKPVNNCFIIKPFYKIVNISTRLSVGAM